MRFHLIVICLLFGALNLPATAQTLPVASPESVGMSSKRLGRIQEALQREIEEGRMPGAVLAIARQGKLAYYEAFGYLDKAAGLPMPKDAIFAIASMTKPVVSVGALMLFEEGRLLMDEPIATYLPELADRRVVVDRNDPSRTVAAIQQPTVQHLLQHTAGFTAAAGGDTALHRLYPYQGRDTPRTFTGTEFLARLSSLPLHYQPGTKWEYGFGFDIMGLAIERISGQRLGTYLAERVFEPLGMVDTFFTIPSDKASRQAKPLPKDPITGAPQTMKDQTTDWKFQCGAGCLASTTMDYLAFAQMLLNRGSLNGVRILGTKTVEFMTSDHMGPDVDLTSLHINPPTKTHTYGYGFGLGVSVRRAAGLGGTIGSPGEFSWFGAQGTAFWVAPQEEMVIVFMAQTPGAIQERYRQLIPALVQQAIVD
ncbi:MAG: serine hydrolase [Acidobacteria bacterium]|nr:serine hydrolase [Acidobacteriota bacterium]